MTAQQPPETVYLITVRHDTAPTWLDQDGWTIASYNQSKGIGVIKKGGMGSSAHNLVVINHMEGVRGRNFKGATVLLAPDARRIQNFPHMLGYLQQRGANLVQIPDPLPEPQH